MAYRDAPWLYDLIPLIAQKIDQPVDDTGRLTWEDPAELVRACNQEHEYLFRRISALAANMDIKIDTSITVASGSQRALLPTDLRKLRYVNEIDSAGNVIRPIQGGSWERLGKFEKDAIFLPRDSSNSGRAVLYFTKPTIGSMKLQVVYHYAPLPLVHGLVRDSGNTTVQLGLHESGEDDVLNGAVLYLPEGTGSGQTKTITDYDGDTRTATVSAWAPLPSEDTTYTSRLDLPRDATDAFVYGVCCRLAEKLQDERRQEWANERERHLAEMKDDVTNLDNQAPTITRDDSADIHGDPLYTYHSL